ncbi:unnamed protein product [Absidia cylindrospora]
MSVQEQRLQENNRWTIFLLHLRPTMNEFSLTDLLQPTMTLEQIKIIEMALAKIKSKRDALLLNEQHGGSTIPSYDWSMVAKQMAKALTTTCNKQSNKNSISSASTSPAASASPFGNSSTAQCSTTSATPNTATTTTLSKPPIPASAITTPPASPPTSSCASMKDSTTNKPTSVEPLTVMEDGVEWVSFVYSHHRVVRQYRIRTDLETVEIDSLEEQFKIDNCVYPRANLPKESYQGNRWSYETECNTLGWKLAHLNMDEIAGKRGLIQRAVDSYRNRYPSMRSRRVARQEKLLKGTLRKRKQSPAFEENIDGNIPCKSPKIACGSAPMSTSSAIMDNTGNPPPPTTTPTSSLSSPSSSAAAQVAACGKIPNIYPSHGKSKNIPKTMIIDDRGVKCRLRINIDSVDLNIIGETFRKTNCVYPRALISTSQNLTQRRQEETRCNEIGWKLVWLNPKHLTNKKNLLQRVLDMYRTKFVPDLVPRRSSNLAKYHTPLENKPTPLTTEALAAHHEQQEQLAAKNGTLNCTNNNVRYVCKKESQDDDNDTIYTGTTDSLDFRDCFSPPPETTTTIDELPTFDDPPLMPMLTTNMSDFGSNNMTAPPPPLPPMLGDEYFESIMDPMASPSPQSLSATLTSLSDLMDDASCHLSVGSSSHNSPAHRYSTFGPLSDDIFADPLLVMPNDNHHHHGLTAHMAGMYMFDTKTTTASNGFSTPSTHLPTDIFAAQDMDWTPDVEDCKLADLHSDVLVHQLFLA